MSIGSVETQPSWVCGACGEPIGGEAALRDHQEWCLGDAAANRRLVQEITRQGALPLEIPELTTSDPG